MSTCSQCGAALDAAETYFDLKGAICCKKCEQAHDIGQLSANDDAAMEALSKKHDRSSLTLKILGAIVIVAAIVGGVVFMKQGASGAAECAPCKLDSDCAAGFKCMEFGAKIESKTKMCGTPQTVKCKP